VNVEYSGEVQKALEEAFYKENVLRPIRLRRYEDGARLAYDVTSVIDARSARITLVIDKFIGGGFAGQVYRVRLLDIDSPTGALDGLEIGRTYAMKILVPSTGFSRRFRNLLYWIGFQGPFQLQVNPMAARAGALWQKFIRRGAKIRFGDERSVVDIHATFVDHALGSCGELSEWVDGRTWRLEVDDRLDLLGKWRRGQCTDTAHLGSPEYRAKNEFMSEFVKLLHDMGGHEFARQYEWSTWKSQPNCLKRISGESAGGADGLVAVDFRAGLTLLPFLPMSPGDFRLIGSGIRRGSLVQFDRGDIARLERFVEEHSSDFADMSLALEELKKADAVYRDSIPDIAHHHVRLLYSSRLWKTIFDGAVTGWQVQNLVDDQSSSRFKKDKLLAFLFVLIGLVPFAGTALRRLWAHRNWREHYTKLATRCDYLLRALRARAAEIVMDWHRAGRIDSRYALKTLEQPWRFLYHLPASILPVGLHRFITDYAYAKQKLFYVAVRPFELYFSAPIREQWLLDMVDRGKQQHILSDEDVQVIVSQIKEPFIQKYLKSLAVHVCLSPVTHIVAFALAAYFLVTHPDMPRAQAWSIALGIVAVFQVVPISPGSLARGLYVLYLVIREKNFRDYSIALVLAFFKYIGYLAFPIQMTSRYPALARFMAGYWATEAVHMVPVFGERGALLEHRVYGLFYNWPLTIRRRMQRRGEIRSRQRPRYWHIGLVILAGLAVFFVSDMAFLAYAKHMPGLKETWVLAMVVPTCCGAAAVLGARGARFGKRILGAAICGAMIGILHAISNGMSGLNASVDIKAFAIGCLWRVFLYAIFSVIGGLVAEFFAPEPENHSVTPSE
jgi:hypothetical protein